MKSCTDLEQSRKLAEILPLESADMRYHTISQYNLYPCDEIVYTIDFGKPSDIDIPCWSLSALLDLLPNNEHIETTISRGSWEIDTVEYLPNTWWCEYEDTENQTEFNMSADNPVDACYEMIEKLHKQMMYDFNNS